MLRQLGAHHVLVASKDDPHFVFARGENSSLDLDARRRVPTHGIDANRGHLTLDCTRSGPEMVLLVKVGRKGQSGPFRCSLRTGRLIFVDFDDLAAAVLAAFGTNAMRRFVGSAIRAKGQRFDFQKVVRAAFACAGLGVSAFWIRHNGALILQLQIAERVPARFALHRLAGAISEIAILAAMGANALAFLPAKAAHRQPQQDLFSQYVG